MDFVYFRFNEEKNIDVRIVCSFSGTLRGNMTSEVRFQVSHSVSILTC